MAESIAIIGAGVAGLAAGCYAQMNGYRTKIFELHDLPGGLCTAWERENYIFDGCIHYLYGSGPGQPFHRMWEELGAVQDKRMIHQEEFMRILGEDGRTFIVYSDPDRLEANLKELSPADARLAEALAQGVRQFERFDMSLLREQPQALMGPLNWMKLGKQMLPFLPPLLQWWRYSAEDFGERFKDPFLRRAIPGMFVWKSIPMMAGLMQLASMHTGNAGFPEGGSLEFALAIERRYLQLGGEIHYKSQVEKILVEGGQAAGVRLYDDSVHRADSVISAADGRATIYDLLGGNYTNNRIKRTYDGHLPIHSQIQVSLGVNRDLSAQPHWITYLLDEPVSIAGEARGEIGVKHYCYDPCLAPPGKSVLEVMLESNYGYWQHIYGRRLYDTEQIQVQNIVIDLLEKWYPGIREQIEVVDVATPLSYERYTGNWMGSTCGWLLTRQTMAMNITGMRTTLPGLKNFYMIGQWVEPGGTLSLAASSGRNIVKTICHADRRRFVSNTP
ncbi:MAG TPA: NAD(P)/FAD-dependent oxidoreductase [Anaerolineales bacterium]|nr:NAD(P)/FAD-dependent oxidoreductase [Anaerolineales bacterium]